MKSIKKSGHLNLKKLITVTSVTTLLMTSIVFAGITADTTSLDNVLMFVLQWVTRIGVVIAIFGGIDFTIAFMSDNPENRTRGLKVIAAGLMLAAIAKAPQIFGF